MASRKGAKTTAAEQGHAGHVAAARTTGGRDVTHALALAQDIESQGEDAQSVDVDELVDILNDIDARTAKRDKKRGHPKVKRAPEAQQAFDRELTTYAAHDAALAEHHGKIEVAATKANALRTLSFGSTDWLSIITQIVAILQELNIIKTNATT